MSQTNLYREYPDIYGKDKLGKTRIWKASVFQNVGTATAVIQHGLHEGKLQVDTRQYTEGKNIGKKNETSPLEQCIAEVEKKRKDKIEKEGYSETGSSPSSGKEDRKYFPMLANKYEPAGKNAAAVSYFHASCNRNSTVSGVSSISNPVNRCINLAQVDILRCYNISIRIYCRFSPTTPRSCWTANCIRKTSHLKN